MSVIPSCGKNMLVRPAVCEVETKAECEYVTLENVLQKCIVHKTNKTRMREIAATSPSAEVSIA